MADCFIHFVANNNITVNQAFKIIEIISPFLVNTNWNVSHTSHEIIQCNMLNIKNLTTE